MGLDLKRSIHAEIQRDIENKVFSKGGTLSECSAASVELHRTKDVHMVGVLMWAWKSGRVNRRSQEW